MQIVDQNDKGQLIVVNNKGIIKNQDTGEVEDNPFVSSNSDGSNAKVYNFSSDEIKSATTDNRTDKNKLKEWNQLSSEAVTNGIWNRDEVEAEKTKIQKDHSKLDDSINTLLEQINSQNTSSSSGKQDDPYKIDKTVANYDKDYSTWKELSKEAQDLGYWNDSEIENCAERIDKGSNNLEVSIAKLKEVIGNMGSAKTKKTEELDKKETKTPDATPSSTTTSENEQKTNDITKLLSTPLDAAKTDPSTIGSYNQAKESIKNSIKFATPDQLATINSLITSIQKDGKYSDALKLQEIGDALDKARVNDQKEKDAAAKEALKKPNTDPQAESARTEITNGLDKTLDQKTDPNTISSYNQAKMSLDSSLKFATNDELKTINSLITSIQKDGKYTDALKLQEMADKLDKRKDGN